MASNAATTDDKSTTVADDDKPVTEADLHDLKYPKDEVETSEEADETSEGEETEEETKETEGEEDGQTDDQAEKDEESEEESKETTDEETSEFVKEFPNIKGDTPEEYAKNLEIAYGHSFEELKRIRGESKPPETGKTETGTESEIDVSDPIALWAKQNLDKEINDAYTVFKKSYPQVEDETAYQRFTNEVSILSQTILSSQKRLAPPKELYEKAAVILGWQPEGKVDDKDKLNIALKDKASTSKTNSATKPTSSKSKVTDQMIAFNRLMYPGKTDAEIRQELEPYV